MNLKNRDYIKLLPANSTEVFHQKFPQTNQTCLACNTCVCACLIIFTLLLADDVVQITAVRQSGVEAHGIVKTARKQMRTSRVIVLRGMRKFCLGHWPSAALSRLPEL